MTTRRSKTAPAAAADIDPEAYYDLTVSTAVTFETVRFGPIGSNEVSGAMLARLLASEQAASVAGYTKRG